MKCVKVGESGSQHLYVAARGVGRLPQYGREAADTKRTGLGELALNRSVHRGAGKIALELVRIEADFSGNPNQGVMIRRITRLEIIGALYSGVELCSAALFLKACCDDRSTGGIGCPFGLASVPKRKVELSARASLDGMPRALHIGLSLGIHGFGGIRCQASH